MTRIDTLRNLVQVFGSGNHTAAADAPHTRKARLARVQAFLDWAEATLRERLGPHLTADDPQGKVRARRM